MKKLFLVLLFLQLTITMAFSLPISFSWTHSTPDTVDGYRLYVKIYPDGESLPVWDGTELECTFEAVEGVKYGFHATAYNEWGESLKSQEIIYTAEEPVAPIVIPSRPTSITIRFE